MLQRKKYIIIILLALFLFPGCQKNKTDDSFSFPANKKKIIWGGFLYSDDGGVTWKMKNKAGDKSLFSLDILSLDSTSQIYPTTIYIGTKKHGIFKSNLSEDWKHIPTFLAQDVYGLAVENSGAVTSIYATGTENKRGKIYKSADNGETWQEIYTEPAEGVKVISLTLDSQGWIYAGNTKGDLFRSNNSGETWENIYEADGPIFQIKIPAKNSRLIYVLVWKKEALCSQDQGSTFKTFNQRGDLTVKNTATGEIKKSVTVGKPYSLDVDEGHPATVYLGTDQGIFKSDNYGKTLEKINTLGSSEEYPIKVLSISPFNSDKIIYVAAKAIYSSDDGGKTWKTFQLNTAKSVSRLMFNKDNPGIIYAGMKK